MTIRELYKWAEENNALDLPLFDVDEDWFINDEPKIDTVFCYEEGSAKNVDMVILR